MEEKVIEPQAERLIKFIKRTGMNHTEFGRECGFKSTRTLQSIHTDGKAPSLKVLNKIVQHFPMLNYDWVLMGVGEMINAGFEKNSSSNSTSKSTKASFGVINKKLSVQDLAVNELGVDVSRIIKNTETNMLVYTQTMAFQGNKIDEMVKVLNKFKEKQEDMQKEHIALIRRLDKERKELAFKLHEDRKKLNRDFWGEITEDFDKKIENNWKRYEQLMIDTNTHFDGLMVDLNKKLDTNIQTAIEMITDSGKNNTAKALKALGEHTVHKKN